MALLGAQVKLTQPNGDVYSSGSFALNVELGPPPTGKATIANTAFYNDFTGNSVITQTSFDCFLGFDVISAEKGAKIKFFISGWDAWPSAGPVNGSYTLTVLSNNGHILGGGNLTSERRTDVAGFSSNAYTLNLPNGISRSTPIRIRCLLTHSGATIPSPTANIVVENKDTILAQVRMKLLRILD